MKKIETIWRELLFQAVEKGNRIFTQKQLAENFGFSLSTVFQALKSPRKMGAVRVGGRSFILEDPEKLLYHWASIRDLSKEILISGHLDLSVFEIEGKMPPEVVFGGFRAARELLRGEMPADYDKVLVYTPPQNAGLIKQRFSFEKGRENLIVLKSDRFLKKYGKSTTLCQTFVDLWNLPEWYAKEYVGELKGKIDALLS